MILLVFCHFVILFIYHCHFVILFSYHCHSMILFVNEYHFVILFVYHYWCFLCVSLSSCDIICSDASELTVACEDDDVSDKNNVNKEQQLERCRQTISKVLGHVPKRGEQVKKYLQMNVFYKQKVYSWYLSICRHISWILRLF